MPWVCDLVPLGMHDRLADFEIIGFSFTFSAGVSSENFDIEIVGVNITPCNWRVLFALNTGVSLELGKESVEVNQILLTGCEDFNRLAVLRSTNSEFT